MFTISLTKTYAKPVTIRQLFGDDILFRLTGADEISSEFETGAAFRLTFNDRGIIHGQFIKIGGDEVVLEWNVEGFQRPGETKTVVEISLVEDNRQCVLSLKHGNIMSNESAAAKERAWGELLDDIEKE